MLDYLPVENAPEAVTLNVEKSKKLGVSQKKSIMVQTDPPNAKEFTDLTYESQDESIAAVDENGVLTGVKKGTCTVTVRTANGLEAQVKVEVGRDPVPDEEPGDDPGTDKPGTDKPGTDKPGISGKDPGDGGSSSGGDKPGDGSASDKKAKAGKKVKTGDESEWIIWLLLLVMGAGAAGSTAYYKKRQKKA